MDSRAFSATGVAVPVIGQGSWDLPERGAHVDDAKRALLRGVELGLTHIDTAEMYGNGRVEEILGEVLGDIDRDTLFLASKVLPSNASYEGTIAACERSLKRLHVEHLDLYMLHWPSSYPIEETMRALEQLVTDGKTRFIGVSNFEVEELREAQAVLRQERLACNQVLYHLRERGMEKRLLSYCKAQEIAVVAYTPFGRGKFPVTQTRDGGILAMVASKYGKTPRQVILRFLTTDPNVFTIPKASTIPHVEENAGGAGWELDAEDYDAIDAAFPVHDAGHLATL